MFCYYRSKIADQVFPSDDNEGSGIDDREVERKKRSKTAAIKRPKSTSSSTYR